MSSHAPLDPFDRINVFIVKALMVLLTLLGALKVLRIELASLF